MNGSGPVRKHLGLELQDYLANDVLLINQGAWLGEVVSKRYRICKYCCEKLSEMVPR